MAGRGELRHIPRGVYLATFGGSSRDFCDETPQIARQVSQLRKILSADFEHPQIEFGKYWSSCIKNQRFLEKNSADKN